MECEICGSDHGQCDFIACRDELAREAEALREQLTAALARITALEAAGRPVVEMLEQRRVSLYGAADVFREKVDGLKRVLEEP